MTLLFVLLTVLLLAPPIAIVAFWRASRKRTRTGELPDVEALILARVGGLLCAVLPPVQLLASIVRYKTGEAGLFLWYLVPLAGVAFAVLALAGFLAHARGRERKVSSCMVLLSFSTLLLITLVNGSAGA